MSYPNPFSNSGPLGDGCSYFIPNVEQCNGSGPSPYGGFNFPCAEISLDANVQYTINSINAGFVVPYGDFGGPNVYWFQTFENALGNLVYTVFDRDSTLGLASFMVRYGAATTLRQVLFQEYPRSEIDLQFLILPRVPYQVCGNGSVSP
jgi:hypothetical protein